MWSDHTRMPLVNICQHCVRFKITLIMKLKTEEYRLSQDVIVKYSFCLFVLGPLQVVLMGLYMVLGIDPRLTL